MVVLVKPAILVQEIKVKPQPLVILVVILLVMAVAVVDVMILMVVLVVLVVVVHIEEPLVMPHKMLKVLKDPNQVMLDL